MYSNSVFCTFSEIEYKLILEVEQEGIEFGIRNSTPINSPWVPLRISYYDNSTVGRSVSVETIRGYNVTASASSSSILWEQLYICGDLLGNINNVQFRWIETADTALNDIRAVTNVTATLVSSPPSQLFILSCYIQDKVCILYIDDVLLFYSCIFRGA